MANNMSNEIGGAMPVAEFPAANSGQSTTIDSTRRFRVPVHDQFHARRATSFRDKTTPNWNILGVQLV
jgi:hypothetical protein